MLIPNELADVLISTPNTLSGAVGFHGTRVPVQALLDTLTDGLPVSDFLEGFPSVREAQAQAVVAWEQNRVREAFGLQPVWSASYSTKMLITGTTFITGNATCFRTTTRSIAVRAWANSRRISVLLWRVSGP